MGARDDHDGRSLGGLIAASLVWLVAAGALALGASSLSEISPLIVLGLGAIFYALYPLVLLIWTLRRLFGGQPAALGALALLGGGLAALWFEAGPISRASVELHFKWRKPVYDQLVAEARAGRLGGRRDDKGWTVGARDGVRYAVSPEAPATVTFTWFRNRDVEEGVSFVAPDALVDGARLAAEPALGGEYRYFNIGL